MSRGCGSELGKKEGQPDLGEGEPGRVSVETQKRPVLTRGRKMEAREQAGTKLYGCLAVGSP